jgi:hypothetical protein
MKKERYQQTVDILGIEYRIDEVDSVSKTEPLLGHIDFLKQVIQIDRSLSTEKKEETLLHEILHGIAEATGLDDVLSEQVVQILSRILFDLFKRQKLISSWMVSEKELSPQQSLNSY